MKLGTVRIDELFGYKIKSTLRCLECDEEAPQACAAVQLVFGVFGYHVSGGDGRDEPRPAVPSRNADGSRIAHHSRRRLSEEGILHYFARPTGRDTAPSGCQHAGAVAVLGSGCKALHAQHSPRYSCL